MDQEAARKRSSIGRQVSSDDKDKNKTSIASVEILLENSLHDLFLDVYWRMKFIVLYFSLYLNRQIQPH